MKNENEMYERYIDELNKYLKTIDFTGAMLYNILVIFCRNSCRICLNT